MTAREYVDCAISMDADLQDDIEVVDGFLDKFRKAATWSTACAVSGRPTPFLNGLRPGALQIHEGSGGGHGRRSRGLPSHEPAGAGSLSPGHREGQSFLRGIVPLIGYCSDYVYYDRHERFAGESKYPLKR